MPQLDFDAFRKKALSGAPTPIPRLTPEDLVSSVPMVDATPSPGMEIPFTPQNALTQIGTTPVQAVVKADPHTEDVGKWFKMDSTKEAAQYLGMDGDRYTFIKQGKTRRSMIDKWVCVETLAPKAPVIEKQDLEPAASLDTPQISAPIGISNIVTQPNGRCFYHEGSNSSFRILQGQELPVNDPQFLECYEITWEDFLTHQKSIIPVQENKPVAQDPTGPIEVIETVVVNPTQTDPAQPTEPVQTKALAVTHQSIMNLTDDEEILEMLSQQLATPEVGEFKAELPEIKINKDMGFIAFEKAHKTLTGFMVWHHAGRVKFKDGSDPVKGNKPECCSDDGIHSFWGTDRKAMNCADCKFSKPGSHWDPKKKNTPGCTGNAVAFLYVPAIGSLPLMFHASYLSARSISSALQLFRGEGIPYSTQPLRFSYAVEGNFNNAVIHIDPVTLPEEDLRAAHVEIFRLLKTYKTNFVPGKPDPMPTNVPVIPQNTTSAAAVNNLLSPAMNNV